MSVTSQGYRKIQFFWSNRRNRFYVYRPFFALRRFLAPADIYHHVQTCLMPMKPNQLLLTQIDGEPGALVVEHILPLAAEILTQMYQAGKCLPHSPWIDRRLACPLEKCPVSECSRCLPAELVEYWKHWPQRHCASLQVDTQELKPFPFRPCQSFPGLMSDQLQGIISAKNCMIRGKNCHQSIQIPAKRG